MVGIDAGVGIGSGNYDTPAGEVPQQTVVVFDPFHPVVAKRHSWQRIAFGGSVDFPWQADEIEVAGQNSVRSSFGQLGQMFRQIFSHD